MRVVSWVLIVSVVCAVERSVGATPPCAKGLSAENADPYSKAIYERVGELGFYFLRRAYNAGRSNMVLSPSAIAEIVAGSAAGTGDSAEVTRFFHGLESSDVAEALSQLRQELSEHTVAQQGKVYFSMATEKLTTHVSVHGGFVEPFERVTHGDYQKADGSVVASSYLQRAGRMAYAEYGYFQMVTVPLGDIHRNEVAPRIVLDIIKWRDPRGTQRRLDLNTLFSELTHNNYMNLVQLQKERSIDLKIAAGRTTQDEISLKQFLRRGSFPLTRVFDSFNDVTTSAMYELTPFGLGASQTSKVKMATLTAPLTGIFSFHVEEPSIHIVRDVIRGTPLLMALYDNPEEYSLEQLEDIVSVGLSNGRVVRCFHSDGSEVVANRNHWFSSISRALDTFRTHR